MGDIVLNLDKVLKNGMITVIRKRNILKARILPRSQREGYRGNKGDILLVSPSGVKRVISRRELVSKYTYLNNAKISLAGWKESKSYIVCCLDNTEALAVRVPLKYTLEVKGKKVNFGNKKSGDYIVVDLDNNGEMIEDTLGIISSNLFKKMYYIPSNELNKLKDRVQRVRGDRPNYASELGVKLTDSKEQPNYNVVSGNTSRNLTRSVNDNGEKQNKFKYMATARIASESGEIVGFVLMSLKTGESRNVTKEQMMVACKKRLVSNVVLAVKSDTGTLYLRGNNIRLENLPLYTDY